MKTSFPKNQIKVVLLEGVHETGAEMLRSEGFSVETLPKALEGKTLLKAASEAHVLGIRSKTHRAAPRRRSAKAKAKSCRWTSKSKRGSAWNTSRTSSR